MSTKVVVKVIKFLDFFTNCIMVVPSQMCSKWKQLLALEMQDTEKIIFSSSDLHWDMVEDNVVASIKSNRFKEFINGESNNPLYPTSF